MNANVKLLLVKCITLLYRESQMTGSHENSSALVRSILGLIKDPQVQMGLDNERDIVTGLKKTALTMCEQALDHEYEPVELLQQLKVDCNTDEALFSSLADGIDKELSDNKIKRTAVNLRRSLHDVLKEEKIIEIVNNASTKLRFKRGEIVNMNQYVAELVGELEPYQMDNDKRDPAIVSSVNFAHIDEVVKVFKEVQRAEEGGSVLKTPWQGINRMLRGGYRRGQETVIGALQHNFKTGFSLGTFIGVALFNEPETAFPEIVPSRKPLLYRVSFEDDLELNLQYTYEVIMNYDGRADEIVVKTKEDFKAMTQEEKDEFVMIMSKFVAERLRVNGFEVIMERVNPSDWTYRHLCNRMLELEADGYEIYMCMADYLPMLPTTGCAQGPTGTDMQDMYRRVRNFMSAKKIAFVTPHQLSTDAKQMIRDGKADFVQELPGKGYYRGCKQIDQEVDLEIYIHIEKVNGESYLTCQRGKHRIIGQTNPKDLYTVLKFEKYGLPFDEGRKDLSRRTVGGGPVGSKDEKPFFDFSPV
jgi:hypothetical protein